MRKRFITIGAVAASAIAATWWLVPSKPAEPTQETALPEPPMSSVSYPRPAKPSYDPATGPWSADGLTIQVTRLTDVDAEVRAAGPYNVKAGLRYVAAELTLENTGQVAVTPADLVNISMATNSLSYEPVRVQGAEWDWPLGLSSRLAAGDTRAVRVIFEVLDSDAGNPIYIRLSDGHSNTKLYLPVREGGS